MLYESIALPTELARLLCEERKKLAAPASASFIFPLTTVPQLSSDLFDYVLPPALVAQFPAERRDQSRLLVVDRATRRVSHHTFADLPRFLRPGDVMIRNNATVLPARLHALRPTGGAVECFLLRPANSNNVWHCLLRPGKKLSLGATFTEPSGAFTARVIARETETTQVQFTTPNGEPIAEVANHLGDVPLPPYIARRADDSPAAHAAQRARDSERYQTVYADPAKQVAVAAPTAGLHFTPELLETLRLQGVLTSEVTLHVGLGTFKPITTATIEEHAIHRELYELPLATQRALFPPCAGRRIAVGTTTVRTVEDFLARHNTPLGQPHFGEAGIFIFPPHHFRGVDALITNFHQPRSTLLCLVAAFLAPGTADGIARLQEIYAGAIARDYRFLSYGDAMLIL